MDKRLAVAHLIPSLARGGAELQLYRRLKRESQLKGGPPTVLIYFRGSDVLEFSKIKDLKVLQAGVLGILKYFFGLGTKRFIIYTHLPQAEILGTLLRVIYSRSIRLVVVRHYEEKFRGLRRLANYFILSCGNRFADRVVCISRATLTYSRRALASSTLECKSKIIHYGIEDVGSENTNVPSKLDPFYYLYETLDPDIKFLKVLWVSRFNKTKDPYLALEIVRNVLRRGGGFG